MVKGQACGEPPLPPPRYLGICVFGRERLVVGAPEPSEQLGEAAARSGESGPEGRQCQFKPLTVPLGSDLFCHSELFLLSKAAQHLHHRFCNGPRRRLPAS